MQFTTTCTLAALTSLVASAAIRRGNGLEVSLSPVGNSGVKATLKNNGAEALKAFNMGSFLDDGPFEKMQISSNGTSVPFGGLRGIPSLGALPEDLFTLIEPGQTIDVDLEASELHDLSPGGAFDVQLKGAFPLADKDSTTLNGKFADYESNIVSLDVDGVEAAKAFAAHSLKKRAFISGDCSGQPGVVEAAFTQGAIEAAAGADAARNNPTLFNDWFLDSDAANVAARLDAINAHMSGANTGPPQVYCTDSLGFGCREGILALTDVNDPNAFPTAGDVVLCPTFFTVPTTATGCNNGQANTLVHEFTHSQKVFSPSTNDGPGGQSYGPDAIRSLNAVDRFNAADTYRLFAQAAAGNC